jgi:plastocyanin
MTEHKKHHVSSHHTPHHHEAPEPVSSTFNKLVLAITLAVVVVSFVSYQNNQRRKAGGATAPQTELSQKEGVSASANDQFVAEPMASSVLLTKDAFSSEQVTIKSTGTVIWINQDTNTHTLRITDGDESVTDVLEPGESFGYIFTTVGDYSYTSSGVPGKTGKIVVQ